MRSLVRTRFPDAPAPAGGLNLPMKICTGRAYICDFELGTRIKRQHVPCVPRAWRNVALVRWQQDVNCAQAWTICPCSKT